MRKIILSIIALISAYCVQAQEPQRYFQYPEPPESLVSLDQRTSFLVEHFWERCNLKSAFSSRAKMHEAFNDYVSFMPYADTTVVCNSVRKLISDVKKAVPAQLPALFEMAESSLYSDSAEFPIDQVYMIFANTAAKSKEVAKDARERYSRQASQLGGSMVGQKLPNIGMTTSTGESKKMNDISASYILILFDDPDDPENMMARVRLSADYSLNKLIERGDMTVISLYPGTADQEWKSRVATYPSNWVVAASPESDRYFDRRNKPTIYYANKNQEILSKSLLAENLLVAFRKVLQNKEQIETAREAAKRKALEQQQKENESPVITNNDK